MALGQQEVSKEVYEALALIKEKRFVEAENFINKKIAAIHTGDNPIAEALLYSTLGILHRSNKKAKEAWRAYQQAEKLMPDDPALKIVIAHFLIDEFAQYGTAIKKAKQVLKLADKLPSFEHQARSTIGLAYLKKGDKKKAIQALQLILEIGFETMVSAANIDFSLVEALMHRNLAGELCQNYFTKALALAKAKKEGKVLAFIEKLKESLEPTLTRA